MPETNTTTSVFKQVAKIFMVCLFLLILTVAAEARNNRRATKKKTLSNRRARPWRIRRKYKKRACCKSNTVTIQIFAVRIFACSNRAAQYSLCG
ncbi:MAG: hypothetical protein WKF71_01870 [Pyrinomonadaceae bacterium]